MGQEYQKNINIISTVPINSQPWFFDGFEGVFDWIDEIMDNASASKSVITTQAYEGSKCLKLDTGATGPMNGEIASCKKKIVYPGNRYIEFAMCFKIDTSNSKERIILHTAPSINGNDYFYGLALNTQTDRMEIGNYSSGFSTVSNEPIYQNVAGWNYMKMVIDIVTNTYIKGQINEHVIDIRNNPGELSGSGTIGGIAFGVGIQNLDNTRRILYVDNTIMRGLDSV